MRHLVKSAVSRGRGSAFLGLCFRENPGSFSKTQSPEICLRHFKENHGCEAILFSSAAPGDSNLKIVAKETKMLQNLRHPKVADCPKPIAVMRNDGVRVSVFISCQPFGIDV